MRFRYRLDGYDPEWVDAGARRIAYYTDLPPGAHTFRVAAAIDDGPWSEGEGVLVVADNGKGFAVDRHRDDAAGQGLRSMKRRAEAIGGRLSIASAPGAGTTIALDAPIR